jgi:predicted GNAT family acetyltransferase
MAQTPIDIDVRDDRDSGRFVVDHNGSTAELTYTAEVRLILAHTEVPLCLEGRGLGGQLVRAAVSRARSEHLTLVPTCPFARRWLRDHPEATEGVTIDWATTPTQGNGGSAGSPVHRA